MSNLSPKIGSQVTRRQLLCGGAAISAATLMPGFNAIAQENVPAPKRGGIMRIGHSAGATSDSLDPATYVGGPVVTAMIGGVCNNLTEVDADGNIVPELATAIEPNADATVWTVTLRPNVTFSNGKSLTPQDVIASYNHHRGDTSTSSAKAILSNIKSLSAQDHNKVVFELFSGDADFPYLCAEYQLPIMQANPDGTMDWQSGIGTGGYVIESFQPGVRMALKRRDNYCKEGRAWFDEIEFFTINDPTARQNALLSGRVDVINSVDLKTLNLLQRAPNITLNEVVGTSHLLFPMWCDAPPFNNRDVRFALKYVIDREEILQKVLQGHGALANDSPIAPANRFYAADLPQRAFDPDKAKFHLKQAEMENLTVELSVSNITLGAIDAATLFQASAKKAGIDITLRREPEDGYWTNVWLKKPFVTGYWNGRSTEDSMFSLVYGKAADWNETHWDNERFNKLLIEARGLLDENLRRDIYREMQQLVSDDGGAIIPMFMNYLDARNNKVAHGKLASNRFFDGWKLIERWWSAV